jgi:hypothetical protein
MTSEHSAAIEGLMIKGDMIFADESRWFIIFN